MVLKLLNCISCCVNAIVIGGHLFMVLQLLNCISCYVTAIVILGFLFMVLNLNCISCLKLIETFWKLHQLLCDCHSDRRSSLYGAQTFKLYQLLCDCHSDQRSSLYDAQPENASIVALLTVFCYDEKTFVNPHFLSFSLQPSVFILFDRRCCFTHCLLF